MAENNGEVKPGQEPAGTEEAAQDFKKMYEEVKGQYETVKKEFDGLNPVLDRVNSYFEADEDSYKRFQSFARSGKLEQSAPKLDVEVQKKKPEFGPDEITKLVQAEFQRHVSPLQGQQQAILRAQAERDAESGKAKLTEQLPFLKEPFYTMKDGKRVEGEGTFWDEFNRRYEDLIRKEAKEIAWREGLTHTQATDKATMAYVKLSDEDLVVKLMRNETLDYMASLKGRPNLPRGVVAGGAGTPPPPAIKDKILKAYSESGDATKVAFDYAESLGMQPNDLMIQLVTGKF